jgi:hypothetical protein
MRETYTLVSRSPDGQDFTVDSSLAHIYIPLSAPIRLSGPLDRYKIIFQSASIPYSMPMISAAKGNNSFKYTVSGVDYTVTFSDGIYTTTQLTSWVNATLETNGHYWTDSRGEKHYNFQLGFNLSTGHSYIYIEEPATHPATVTFTTSTFYNVIGFRSTDSISVTTSSANMVDLAQGEEEVFIYLNIARSSLGSNIGSSNLLYSGVWTGSPYEANRFPDPSENSTAITAGVSTSTITHFEIWIRNKAGQLMALNTSAQCDSVTLRIVITDEPI